MSDKTKYMLATVFYIGNSPFAPGSMASLAGMFLYFILFQNMFLYVVLFAVITYIGFKICGDVENSIGQKDPGCIVIDEVSGVMISFFLLPLSVPIVITTYFLFRAFDMFKVYPVNKFEEYGGAKGIMLDDVVAGIYTNIVMHIAIRLAGIV